jgi:peptidoglycan/LPS O-acetylase OafA/YrhL
MSTDSSNAPRGNNFDLLRFALAVLVIYSHSFPLASSDPEMMEPVERFSAGRTSIGSLAVDCFFVISGFLITQSWLRSRSLAGFLKRRVLRIAPGYAVAILICHFVFAPLAYVSLSEIFSGSQTLNFLTRLIPLRAYNEPTCFPHNAHPFIMNESLWTIRFELACYLLVPVLSFWQCYRNPRRLLLLLGALLGCRLALACFAPPSTPDMAFHWVFIKGMARFATCFVAGSLFLTYGEKLPRSRWAVVAAALLLCAVCKSSIAFPVVGPLCTTFIVMRLALSQSVPFPRFGRHGDFSYGIYLYAYPIQQLVAQYYGPGLTANMLFALAIVPSLAFGIASWFCVERRFLPRTRHAQAVAAADAVRGSATTPALRFDPALRESVPAPKQRLVAEPAGEPRPLRRGCDSNDLAATLGKALPRRTRRAEFQAQLLEVARRRVDRIPERRAQCRS